MRNGHGPYTKTPGWCQPGQLRFWSPRFMLSAVGKPARTDRSRARSGAMTFGSRTSSITMPAPRPIHGQAGVAATARSAPTAPVVQAMTTARATRRAGPMRVQDEPCERKNSSSRRCPSSNGFTTSWCHRDRLATVPSGGPMGQWTKAGNGKRADTTMSEDNSDRQVARSTDEYDVSAAARPRRAGDSELTFIVLAVLALVFLTVALVPQGLAGVFYLTVGFYATAASLVALAWALVRYRGRIVAKAWWTFAVLVTFHVVTEVYFATLTTPACSQAVPC